MQIEDAKTSMLHRESFSFDNNNDIELELDCTNLPRDLTHTHSTLTEDEISELVKKYHFPMKGFWYVAPSNLRTHQSSLGGLAICKASLETGCRFSFENNLAEIFRIIGLCPSQLVPNEWKSLVAFIICCQGKGIIPKAELFLKLFYLVCIDKFELHYSFIAFFGCKFLVDNPSSLKGRKN